MIKLLTELFSEIEFIHQINKRGRKRKRKGMIESGIPAEIYSISRDSDSVTSYLEDPTIWIGQEEDYNQH